ncbi:uncharacterized protein RCC_08852 [Ramularia collo-cygni]|uniref:Uncharacterized protein n=1 Tax=Ramularia collo-cygni TaxID=112498 RepID=A0A2D3VDK8_9PEZI|nr:uncharacterized protein RCC_08852 [Ramularia collo-cygni]CZT23142.1 uncharacterized protein RCC_08852 [Ramularia collo-cygni]
MAALYNIPTLTYLPTRHEFLQVAAFYKRVHAHRQRYTHVDFDQPFETYLRSLRQNTQVDQELLIEAKKAEEAADFLFRKEWMGMVFVVTAPHWHSTQLETGWINKSKFDPASLVKISRGLDFCAVHDAWYEIVLRLNLEWFEQIEKGVECRCTVLDVVRRA